MRRSAAGNRSGTLLLGIIAVAATLLTAVPDSLFRSALAQQGLGRDNPGGSRTGVGPRANTGAPGPRGAAQGATPRVPQRRESMPLAVPAWASQLTPEHLEYLNQILQYWEFRSSKIEIFKCDFTRWRYDPVFVAPDPESGELPAKEITTGIIRYERPDKALYQDEKVYVFQPPKEPGGKAGYAQLPSESGEHWICNGTSVFEFDHGRKQLIETELPPEYRGNKIVENGPLPFLFGAKADKIKQRYWLRVITPDKAEGEYWIEAYPKNQQDAANFKMVHIIIDEKDYLPKALIMFNRNFDPVRHPARTTFEFKNRVVNPTLDQLKKLNIFHTDFHEPKTPAGWEKVVEPYRGRPAAPEAAAPTTARPTRNGPRRR